MTDTTKKQTSPGYARWLKNAFQYYHGDGTFYDMSDAVWDHQAKLFAEEEKECPGTYPELQGRNYEGGSLFFLKAADYPAEAKTRTD